MNNYNEDVLNIDRTVLYAKKEFLKAVCNIAIINIIELSMSLKFLILKYNNNKDCFILCLDNNMVCFCKENEIKKILNQQTSDYIYYINNGIKYKKSENIYYDKFYEIKNENGNDIIIMNYNINDGIYIMCN